MFECKTCGHTTTIQKVQLSGSVACRGVCKGKSIMNRKLPVKENKMNHVVLSKKLTITGVLKKTKAKFFKDLAVGDVLIIALPLEWGESGYGGLKVAKLNLACGSARHQETIGKVSDRLLCFEFESDNYPW